MITKLDNQNTGSIQKEFKIHVGSKDEKEYFLTQFDLNTYLLVEHNDGTTHIFTQKKEIKTIVQKILKGNSILKQRSKIMSLL